MTRHLSPLERLLSSLVMAAGVILLTAGLLSYVPSAFGEWGSPEPSIGADDPLFTANPPAGSPTPVPLPSATQGSPSPLPSATPIETRPGESATPSPAPRAFATRIRIPALRIDLPVVSGELVVEGNPDMYPLCDVAMYLTQFVQPGEAGTTYIYAHAQRGMFLPLLRASTMDDGAGMIGALIEVHTSNDELHLYEIVLVKRHATDLSLATDSGEEEQLVLQTSEGPSGTVPKLQVAARPVSVIRATGDEARPSPQPRVCLPGG